MTGQNNRESGKNSESYHARESGSGVPAQAFEVSDKTLLTIFCGLEKQNDGADEPQADKNQAGVEEDLFTGLAGEPEGENRDEPA